MSYAGPANQKSASRPPLKRLMPTSSFTDDRNVAFLAGVVLGAAVGAGVALLLAPRSGRSTRRRIARSGREITQRGRDAWHELADELGAVRRRRHDSRDAREARSAREARHATPGAAQRKSFSLRAASSL